MARKGRATPLFEDILFGRTANPAPRPPQLQIFVYDRRLFDPQAGGWLPEHRARPAKSHGRLFRDGRWRYGFVPGAEGEIIGSVVEILPEQLPILDFVVGTAGGVFRRETIDVSINLVPARAETWVLADDRGFRPVQRRAK